MTAEKILEELRGWIKNQRLLFEQYPPETRKGKERRIGEEDLLGNLEYFLDELNK